MNLLRFVGYDACVSCAVISFATTGRYTPVRKVHCDSGYTGLGLPFDHDTPFCERHCNHDSR